MTNIYTYEPFEIAIEDARAWSRKTGSRVSMKVCRCKMVVRNSRTNNSDTHFVLNVTYGFRKQG